MFVNDTLFSNTCWILPGKISKVRRFPSFSHYFKLIFKSFSINPPASRNLRDLAAHEDVANASGGEGNFNRELNRRKRRKVAKAKPSKAGELHEC